MKTKKMKLQLIRQQGIVVAAQLVDNSGKQEEIPAIGFELLPDQTFYECEVTPDIQELDGPMLQRFLTNIKFKGPEIVLPNFTVVNHRK